MTDVKKQILDKFRDMWETVSVKNITMDSVASRCGISKKTIYKYFKSKDEIVHSISNDLFSQVRLSIEKLDDFSGKPVEAINYLFQESYNIFGDVSDILISDIRSYYPEIEAEVDGLIDEIGERFRAFFQEGVRMNLFKNINPYFTFMFYRAAADTVFKAKNILENDMTVKEAIAGFRELIFTGITVNEKGGHAEC